MGNSMKIFLLLVSLLLASNKLSAAIETHEFANDLDRTRYQSFIQEMRCPKCQNQNLAGSDSLISTDLRREIYEMIQQGKSDREIVDFMVARYGEFILYRPRVSPVTYVLWGAPAVLLLLGVITLIVILRRRRLLALGQTSQNLTPDEQARLLKLLSAETTPKNISEPRS